MINIEVKLSKIYLQMPLNKFKYTKLISYLLTLYFKLYNNRQ